MWTSISLCPSDRISSKQIKTQENISVNDLLVVTLIRKAKLSNLFKPTEVPLKFLMLVEMCIIRKKRKAELFTTSNRASNLIYLIDIHSLQYLSQKLNPELRNLVIPIAIDKKNRRLPKPFNNHPGYDLKYVELYINKYCGINDYQRFFDELFETERRYDTLLVIKPYKTPVQWAIRVRVPLQELISERKRSVYHVHALFLAFSKGRYVKILEPKDLMQEHWDHDCNKPKTRDGSAKIIQNVWRRFQEKTREQFNQWCTKWIELYKNNPMMRSSIINRQYKEYYILDNWIEWKKSQLQIRFQK
ncbi:7177_t:CDS:2 [Cetraspora pellucida]|uniref:7177_t:CDS:1 n=1 Tax=Cetraspora pellucida TaxID=1433469 RepID=A0A9N9I5E3_9GLOM|nr:7177_t:CDS:2 [Cetraspora pellucida]